MSNALDLHNYVIANRMLLPSLVDQWNPARSNDNHTERVYIIGNGPSAASLARAKHSFDSPVPPRTKLIVLNGAIKLFPEADIWLTCESKCWSAPWFRECPPDFGGIVIMEHDCIGYMLGPEVCGGDETADPFDFYDEAWWKRGIYVNRTQWETSERDIREPGAKTALSYGTYHFTDEDGYPNSRNAGTVLWQAIHLAGILGASECHLYGTELMWGYGGDQHADSWCPYNDALAAKAGELALVRFDIDYPNRFSDEPDGEYETQQMFLDSAYVLPAFMQEAARQGMTVKNHSGGLLDLNLGV